MTFQLCRNRDISTLLQHWGDKTNVRSWGKKTEVMLMILPYLSYLTVRSSDIPSILWPLTGQYTL
jgi:hypothetical protein